MTSVNDLTTHEAKAKWLVRQAHANNGLAPLDTEKFWADQAVAAADPFGRRIPQVALGITMYGDAVYDELGIPEDCYRYGHDLAWRLEVNKAYNDKAEKIIGRRPLSEVFDDPARRYPRVKDLADVFEAKNVWHDQSWWLQQSAHNEDELKALLDRVEQRDIRQFILPPNWAEEKARLQRLGVKPPRYRFLRGPVTFATSIYGGEDFLLLVLDNPDLAVRLRDAMIRSMLAIARVLDEEAGDAAAAPHGFQFNDDNCCLMTPAMYELFGYPVLKTIFETFSPNAGDLRYQHSDSTMGHLMPILSRLNMTGVNLGPTLRVDEIRAAMPRTIIDGQLAPFTFSRNEEENIVMEFLRDYELAGDARGLRFATAGSINNGSRLTGMRLAMSAIQHFGRYE